MSVVLVIAGGVGDQIEGLKCAFYVGDPIKILSCSRDEVFKPLYHLFHDQFVIKQISEEHAENYKLLLDPELANSLKGDAQELYFVVPDLLYRGPYAFDYKKYNVSISTIKSTRLLKYKYKPKNEIYLGLMTTTPGYLYYDIIGLATSLARCLPEYIVHLPILPKWANQEIKISGLPILNKPDNLIIYENPDFIDQLEIQKRCCYGIYSCNGPSHIAFHLGQPRLLLDPQFERCAWIARWKENPDECIDIKTLIQDVIDLVKTNLSIPQTMLLPHRYVMDIIRNHKMLRTEPDWGRILILKF